MLFTENPLRIFQDTYFLVKAVGFTGEYVDGMVPAEREVYKGIFLKQQEDEKKQQEESKGGIDL